jgi:chromosome segregation protein
MNDEIIPEEGELGIEITACPPGKRIESLASLSGGERSLTSLALLFAIISHNPPPFAVLDEVEAALDEANSRRFSRILQDLGKATQFIAITHNRETMRQASLLYGVTMGADGVSQLLSVKLDKADAIAK